MTRILTLLFAALLITTTSAIAQEPPPPEEAGEDMRSRLRMMQMYALTEALELDEATAAKLFPYLREGDEAMAKVHDEMRVHRKALRALADTENIKDKDIDEHIGVLGELEQEMAAIRADQVDGLKRILSPSQRLRFVLTRAKIERELRRVLRERRRGDREGRTRGEERHDGRRKSLEDGY
ncbi:MAG: periplasmic heavy metal sensor [Deltaproteobacteria bacterium]|nr:periplasmic heavy metal sensor [Deltaproteobacteria bacterium]